MPTDLFSETEVPKGYPLSTFVQMVGNTLRKERALQYAWVQCELSDVRSSGGHCYAELIEKNDSGQTIAKVRANCWSNTFYSLRHKFLAATGKDITSGLKVLVLGSITHHNLYGLSFNITDIDPSYTMGDLERQRREILMALQKEGVIDANKHLEMPPLPQRIAVISAAGAAGYGDFIDQLHRNPQGIVFYPKLFEAVMQGDRTAPSVMAALERIEMTIDMWDCVVIIRGGGSTTDLNGFDNLELARRVATFALPVIVGIGHERDRNVLDEIANVRAKTPTAVAEYLIDRITASYTRLADLAQKVRIYAADHLQGEHRRISALEASLPILIKNIITRCQTRLQTITSSIPMVVREKIRISEVKLDSLLQQLKAAPSLSLEREKRKLESLEKLTAVLDPDATLRRGYSITRYGGVAVKEDTDLPEGAVLETRLAGGKSILSKYISSQ